MQGERDAMLRDSFMVLSQQSMPHRWSLEVCEPQGYITSYSLGSIGAQQAWLRFHINKIGGKPRFWGPAMALGGQ